MLSWVCRVYNNELVLAVRAGRPGVTAAEWLVPP